MTKLLAFLSLLSLVGCATETYVDTKMDAAWRTDYERSERLEAKIRDVMNEQNRDEADVRKLKEMLWDHVNGKKIKPDPWCKQ